MVIVYSKPNCQQCNATKRAFNNKGILFEEIDITKNQNAFDKLAEMGYKSAPVVEYNGDYWSGFQPDKISML